MLNPVKHYKRVFICIEPNTENSEFSQYVIPGFHYVKRGSNKITIGLNNLSDRDIIIQKGTVIATCQNGNIVPPKIACRQALQQVTETKPESTPSENIPKKQGFVEPGTKLSEERREELFKKIDLSGIQDWDPKLQEKAKLLFEEFHHIFALNMFELGKIKGVKHEIKLSDPKPFKERYRRIPPHQFEEVRKHVKEMLDIGAIRESKSDFCSAVVLVKKKDGKMRFCIDLRKLNNQTVKDNKSLPRLSDSLDYLTGATLFSCIDLLSGYWQIELEEDSKRLCAFTLGPIGFFEPNLMAFGLSNGPATFQRAMENALGELHLQYCLIYLDDIIVFSRGPEEHLERLAKVFQKLSDVGAHLKPGKCSFFQPEILFLGHRVSALGVGTDSQKIEAIQKWPVPRTVTDVRSFLGFTNYYRRFIKGYAQVAKPLNKLIAGENAKKKKKLVDWTEEHQKAFEELKAICSNPPILAFAKFDRPFILHTDASFTGLGAVLYQKQDDGTSRVIAYASRTLNKAESNYDAHKLEFLALRWAVCEQFHEYLFGGVFEVYTDNNPLTYILTTAKLDAQGQRWVAQLAQYNFQIFYRSGKLNIDADALSRIPWAYTQIEADSVEAVLQMAEVKVCHVSPVLINLSVEETAQICQNLVQDTLPKISKKDWKNEQRADPNIDFVISLIDNKEIAHYKLKNKDSSEVRILLKFRDKLIMKNGLLYRKATVRGHDEEVLQFVLPKSMRERVIESCHTDNGHFGMERTFILVSERFFWPKMGDDVRLFIRRCSRCTRFKQPTEKEELQSIIATYPFELVHLDYLTLGSSKSSERNGNILVVTDHFSKYAQAFVTKNQTAKIVAITLWNCFFVHYGWPAKLLTDQGKSFDCDLIKELCEVAQVQKLRTTPYSPMGNGACERFNKTLISMLGTLPTHAKPRWPEYISTLTHAYNCTYNAVTGYSPFYLVFGRHPRLPIDTEIDVTYPNESAENRANFAKKLKARLQWAYEVARKNNIKASERNKQYYDQKVRCHKIEKGDLVLVRIKVQEGDHKIADKWEQNPYKVTNIRSPQVFEVEEITNSQNDKRIRVLHRNMLFPFMSLIEENTTVPETQNNVIQIRSGNWVTDEFLELYFDD